MTTNQYIYIGILALILLSYVDTSFIYKIFGDGSKNYVTIDEERDSLIEIVGKWDELRLICLKNNLHDAIDKLNEIFPMLIKGGTK